MKLQEIQNEVLKNLNSKDGCSSVDGRRKKMEQIADALDRLEGSTKTRPRLRSRKAWFSTNQSNAKGKAFNAKVQVLGHEIADLYLDTTTHSEHRYKFRPKLAMVKKIFSDGAKDHVGPWLWSHCKQDSTAINDYLKACKEFLKAKSGNEREIQWQLANALKSEKTGALRDLKPVTWNGLFTEVGVSIKSGGTPGTGNIDLVVRCSKGARGFLVFELKKPKNINIEAALAQALRYAIALNIEANDSERHQETYRKVFGAGGKKKLKIGAVAVLEEDRKGEVKKKAGKFLNELLAKPYDRKLIDRIGVLLYKFDGEKAGSWKWLEGWDARKAPWT
jgi:hypothetical protein